MRPRWTLAFAAALLLQISLPGSPAEARWQDWPGEWSPGRPTIHRSPAPTAAPRPLEAPVFRLVVPHRTQKDGGRWEISNCGPATLGMVLDAFGIPGQATDDLRYRSHVYQGTVGSRTGTALQHIAQVAEELGVPTFGLYAEGDRFHSWSLDEVRAQLRLGHPVMSLVRLYQMPGYEGIGPRWGHYVLLTGLSEDGFFYSDSLQLDPEVGSARTISATRLERAMRESHVPGQAVAFGQPGAVLDVWLPEG